MMYVWGAMDEVETESRSDTLEGGAELVLVVILDGTSSVVALPASGEVAIGRAKACGVSIDHASVSRRHASLEIGERIVIEDAGSRNGTRVRGVRLAAKHSVTVHPGDVIEIGGALVVLRRARKSAPDTKGEAEVVPELKVGPEARWFEAPGAERVNLGRRGPLRRVLLRLTEARSENPGTGLPVDDLIAAGWPGERMQYEAALARVYTTVQRLRALGLKELLITRDDGYLLDAAVRMSADGITGKSSARGSGVRR
jgi:hypothetical protein